MNKWTGFGWVAQAPDHGQTKTGTQYCNFAIGVHETRRKKNDKTKSLFLDCVAYGDTAEWLKSVGQGSQIVIEDGEVQEQSWKDNQDRWQKKIRILVHKFIAPESFKGSKKNRDAGQDLTMEQAQEQMATSFP
jgi:single-stranded DNA-binding protein